MFLWTAHASYVILHKGVQYLTVSQLLRWWRRVGDLLWGFPLLTELCCSWNQKSQTEITQTDVSRESRAWWEREAGGSQTHCGGESLMYCFLLFKYNIMYRTHSWRATYYFVSINERSCHCRQTQSITCSCFYTVVLFRCASFYCESDWERNHYRSEADLCL